VRAPSGVDLRSPRDLGSLIGDALAVYGRHFGAFFLLAAAIVIPVQLVVSGVGLEQLSSSYKESPSAAETAVPTLVSLLVVAPLINGTCIHALREVAGGSPLSSRRAITAGFEEFAPIFVAIVLAAVGIALGLLALIVPGVYLAVRWFFVPQTVVLERARGPEALRRSAELVQGRWWRTFGIVLVANLVAAVPAFFLVLPFDALARAADRQLFALAGAALSETLTAPFVALLSTLLYYDLRARRGRGP
jgi:Membrane domain of glycerophosphoryl diester phosphodiesterase